MTKTKTTKRSLISSIIALALCFTMLLGTTFAWFTDSVASSGNIIKSGTLNIDLLVKGGNLDTAALDTAGVDKDGDYYSFKSAADKGATTTVFNYDLWEPGYATVANVKVKTTGTLALKYKLTIEAAAAAAAPAFDLADVIDVYYAPEEKTITSRDAIATELNKIGTLKDVLNGTVNIDDTLIPGSNEEDFATLALVMQTTAGNDYQDLSIDDAGFTIKVVAGQAEYESDTFGTDYDANAEYAADPTAAPISDATPVPTGP